MTRRLSLLNLGPILLSGLGTLSSSNILANNDSASPLREEIQWLQEESYVSTATKTLEHIKKSGASVSVITQKELELSGARNLMDALDRVPGINVQTTNIGIPAVSVRGVKTDSSEKVLFMINGHSVNNNLVNGGATWTYGDFQVEEIKRVEVVRGPGSALYGTNAFVAIINIVTKSAEDINQANISLGGGNNGRRTLNVANAYQENDWDLAFNFNALDTDGINKKVDADGFGDSGHTLDWEKRYDLGINGSYNDFRLNAKLISRESGPYIGISNVLNDESEQDYLEYFVEVSFNKSLDNVSLSAKAYIDHFEANNYWELYSEGFPGFGSGAFPDGFIGSPTVKNQKYGAELQAVYELSQGHKVLGGISFEHQTQYDVRHLTNFNPNTGEPLGSYQNVSDIWNWNGNESRDVSAIYVQDIWDVNESLRLIVGARNDHYSDFGESLNPRSSIIWDLSRSASLTLLYGQAFRAPNFGELFNINTSYFAGNEDLEPEEIETFEARLDLQLGKRQTATITLFKNNISNIIDDVGGVAQNVGKLETNGFELEYDNRFRNGSNFDINYTYQYPQNKDTSKRAHDIPLHQVNAAYTHRFSRYLSSYLGSQYVSTLGRKPGDNRDDVPEQITFDLALTMKSESKAVEVTTSIYNLFNERSFDAAKDNTPLLTVQSDFPTEGRTFVMNVKAAL